MKEEILEKIYNANKSLIVNGNVLSGKTTNVILPLTEKMIENNESLFILDPREEYINNLYDKLKENNYNIVIINLKNLDKSEGWNPLEYPYQLFKNGEKDKAQEYIEKIGKTIYYENLSQDPFWTIAASDFFTGVTLGLFEDGTEKQINFHSINNMFNGTDTKFGSFGSFGSSDYLSRYFNDKGTTNPSYIYASTTFLAPKDTKGSILSVARQKLKLYVSREKLSQLINKTTFSYEDIINKPSAIFFIAKEENKSLNSLPVIFMEQLYNMLFDKKTNNKFNLILDNLDIIEKLNGLGDMVESSSSKGIKLVIGTRSIDEMIIKYGSYIPKLCDLINVENETLSIMINNENQTENKVYQKLKIDNNYIEYPNLLINKIEIFDLPNYVLNHKKNSMINSVSTLPESSNDNTMSPNTDINDLLKNINEKIEELEIEEIEKFKKEKDLIENTEMQQFKVEE